MKRIKILDCTLRDGGSLNNWIFGKDKIQEILQRLNDANLDIIEIGFIDNNACENIESSLNSSNEYFENMSSLIRDKRCNTVAMIDVSKYKLEKFNLSKSENLNGIRIMFNKEQMSSAFNLAEKLQELGYEISLNPVSVTGYSDNQILELIKEVNNINIKRLYIVDTYGLLNMQETLDKYRFFNENLKEDIEIGYHSHNNLQLSFANSLALISEKDTRDIVIDSSLYGMGKRAGNTPTELIANYLNKSYNANYDIDIITDLIDRIILPMHNYFNWGYSFVHYIAAINNCHSDYVSYLRSEKKLSFSKISEILEKIDEVKKLKFDKKYADEIILGEIYGK